MSTPRSLRDGGGRGSDPVPWAHPLPSRAAGLVARGHGMRARSGWEVRGHLQDGRWEESLSALVPGSPALNFRSLQAARTIAGKHRESAAHSLKVHGSWKTLRRTSTRRRRRRHGRKINSGHRAGMPCPGPFPPGWGQSSAGESTAEALLSRPSWSRRRAQRVRRSRFHLDRHMHRGILLVLGGSTRKAAARGPGVGIARRAR